MGFFGVYPRHRRTPPAEFEGAPRYLLHAGRFARYSEHGFSAARLALVESVFWLVAYCLGVAHFNVLGGVQCWFDSGRLDQQRADVPAGPRTVDRRGGRRRLTGVHRVFRPGSFGADRDCVHRDHHRAARRMPWVVFPAGDDVVLVRPAVRAVPCGPRDATGQGFGLGLWREHPRQHCRRDAHGVCADSAPAGLHVALSLAWGGSG